MAAALNLLPLPLSLGYAYLDRPIRFVVSSAIRCVVAVAAWTYLWHFLESCRSGSCSGGADTWALIVVAPLAVMAVTARDGWLAAEAHNRTAPALTEGDAPRGRRSGRGTLTIMGAMALLALGTLRIGDALSASILIVVTVGWWLMWRRGLSRLPDDYRPPDERQGPTPR